MPPSNPNNYPFGLHTVSQLSTAATQALGAEQCAQFSCSLCRFVTHDQSLLVAHGRTHKKVHACTICDFKTPHKTTMSRHILAHTGAKPFACQQCDYRAAQKGHLTRHERTHTNARPFHCTVCPFRANQKGHLVRHFRSHTGEKPFACDQCGFRSNHQSNLVRHSRLHTSTAAKALLLLCQS
eukprot:m.136392 g.136392  ORF g.136392 m.136392 type:complete len:182 (+) comp13942_c0_seq1:556-1101(+)